MAGDVENLPHDRFKEKGWMNGIGQAKAEVEIVDLKGAVVDTASADDAKEEKKEGAVDAASLANEQPVDAATQVQEEAAGAASTAMDDAVAAEATGTGAQGTDGAATASEATSVAVEATTAGDATPGTIEATTAGDATPGTIANTSIIMPEYEALRNNESLPLVYMDITIKGQPVGRMEMVLFTDVSPRHAENFRQLCSGEKGAVAVPRSSGHAFYHFKGGKFYRIVRDWINQAGVEVESVFGGTFADDAGGLALKHDHRGLLSSANMGPNTNEGHFSIMMGPSPHLNGGYTIFGQVVAGWEVSQAINAVSKGLPEETAHGDAEVVIADAGQLRKGTLVPDLKLGLPANATGYNV